MLNIEKSNIDKRYLVIADNQSTIETLPSVAEFSKDVISVCHSSEFKKNSDTSYELDLSNKTQFEQLFDSLVNEKITEPCYF